MFQQMQEIYYRDGYDMAQLWWQTLSDEEQDQLRTEIQQAVTAIVDAYQPVVTAFAAAVPRVVEHMWTFLNAYMEANPDEFERWARKERHRRRYERMMRRRK
jgi:hypothetical protein